MRGVGDGDRAATGLYKSAIQRGLLFPNNHGLLNQAYN